MSSKIKILIGVLLVVVLVVLAIVLLTGGDDDGSSTGAANGEQRDGGDGGDGESNSDSPPSLRTVSMKRSEGPNAAAAAGGIIDKPTGIYLRVSAAPKQEVKGSWNVSCGGGTTDMDTFTAKPPYLLKLRIPRKNADSCVAGASAQLSGEGRLKVAILRER